MAVLAGFLFVNIASAVATGPQKTMTQCDKLTDMQWDTKTKKRVKK